MARAAEQLVQHLVPDHHLVLLVVSCQEDAVARFQWPAQVPPGQGKPGPSTTNHCTRSKSPVRPEQASVRAHHSL